MEHEIIHIKEADIKLESNSKLILNKNVMYGNDFPFLDNELEDNEGAIFFKFD